jgi:uncharacterized integral membrane protein (TIGR00698 family)
MQFRPAHSFPVRLARHGGEVLPGLLLTIPIAAIATAIGSVVPVLGSALPAIVIGVVAALIRRPAARFQPGIDFSGKFLLQLAVVLLGAQLSVAAIVKVGAESLPVMLATLTVCLLGTGLIGRALRVAPRLRTLIGVGTGICGASAIAAVSPVIGALSAEVSYAVSTIFVFNILAVLLFPLLGHALGMDPHTFGLLAGTAVNDTSSVVATASVFGASALGYAVVVKLVRTLMIIPISVGLSLVETRRQAGAGSGAVAGSRRRLTVGVVVGLVPWFLIGFVAVAVLGSLGAIPPGPRDTLVHASAFLISTAMAGIGLSTDAAALRRAGWRPLALGAILWALVTATSLGVIALTGR